MPPEKGSPLYTVYNRVLAMVFCDLLQLPVPSDECESRGGEVVTAWSPMHYQGQEQHPYLVFVLGRILREALVW